MDKQKKSNLISLKVYRKKKQKLNLKKSKKAVSDEEIFFSEEGQISVGQSDNFENNNRAKIYSMTDRRKTENTAIEEKPKDIQKKLLQVKVQEKIARIFNLSDYRKTKQDHMQSLNQYGSSKLIDLENYRKSKESEKVSLYKKTAVAAKQAVAYGTIALMTVFALNIFFPKWQENGRGLASPDKPVYEDEFFKNKEKDTSPLVINGTKVEKDKNIIKRGISSFLQDFTETKNSSYIQKLKNKDLANEKIINGVKPSSSTYTGF